MQEQLDELKSFVVQYEALASEMDHENAIACLLAIQEKVDELAMYQRRKLQQREEYLSW